MEFLKKYLPVVFIWVITLVIIIVFWGSGRFYMIFPALLTTVGYYLLNKAYEGKRQAQHIINCSAEGIKEGLAKAEGIIKTEDEPMLSPIKKDKVVFYDIAIEKGKGDYSNFKPEYNSSDVEKQKLNQAKWSLIGREDKWNPFYIEIENQKEKLYVNNPEYADGKWIYKQEELSEPSITTFGEASDKIKQIINDTDLKNNNTDIEQGRYIRFLERVIKEGEKIIIYGTVEKIQNDDKISYNIKQGEKGVFIITNDAEYDFYIEEHKQYIKGMVILVLGLIGMLTAFIWPWILDFANKTTIPS